MLIATCGGRNVEGRPYVYYRCDPSVYANLNGDRDDNPHQAYMIRVDNLTEVVTIVVKEKVLRKDFTEALRETIAEMEKSQEENAGKLRGDLEKEGRRIEVRRNALAEAVLDGAIPRDVARRKQEELTVNLVEIERQLEALSVDPPPHPIHALRNLPPRAVERALENDKGLRSLLVALVARVEMEPDHRGKIIFTGIYPTEPIAIPRKRGRKTVIA